MGIVTRTDSPGLTCTTWKALTTNGLRSIFSAIAAEIARPKYVVAKDTCWLTSAASLAAVISTLAWDCPAASGSTFPVTFAGKFSRRSAKGPS